LAIGLVIATTLTAACAAHWLVPELPWAVCFILGAVVAPTDAVAALAIAQVACRVGICAVLRAGAWGAMDRKKLGSRSTSINRGLLPRSLSPRGGREQVVWSLSIL
jgi:NhaP-type Na+/H+ or K+/H+ antiporter